MKGEKLKGLIVCLLVYIIALGAAAATVKFLPWQLSVFWLVAWADVVATVVVFAFSVTYKNSSIYDPYWSVVPPVVAYYWMPDFTVPKALVLIVILLWAARLTLNWARGWSGLGHQDWRYVMLREQHPGFYQFINFSGIHMFSTVMVFLGLIPVYYVVQTELEWNMFLIAGAVISVAATFIEWIADEQMRTFKKNALRTQFIQQGLWCYSRHPNYFGEIGFWFGLWVMTLGVDFGLWWTGIGWVSMALMFVFISIPMMEKKNAGSKEGYALYVQQVSMLVPWFRK